MHLKIVKRGKQLDSHFAYRLGGCLLTSARMEANQPGSCNGGRIMQLNAVCIGARTEALVSSRHVEAGDAGVCQTARHTCHDWQMRNTSPTGSFKLVTRAD